MGVKETTKSTLRIVAVTGIFPPDIGGPATYVPWIAQALSERGHNVVVLTLGDSDHHDDSAYPFRILRIHRSIPLPLRLPLTVWKIWKLGRTSDLLFVNGLHLEASIANVLLRKPMVHKIVSDWAWERSMAKGWMQDSLAAFQHRRYGFRVSLHKALRTWCTRAAATVIVPSQFLEPYVVTWGIPKQRIRIIYNSVDLPAVTPAKLPLTPPFKMVTVGRLITLKGIDGIIRILPRFKNVGLTVIGDGPERGRLEDLASALSVSHRVYFAGSRTRGETLGMMAASDLLVSNSTHEGLPHVVLEAMALGLPIVATRVGGTPEALREGAGYLIGNEPDELEEAVRRLSEDSELRRHLGEVGRRAAGSSFSSIRMLQETERAIVNAHEGTLGHMRAKKQRE
jgi:glycosyltransferase involved in cell wall biosynthesis